MVTYIKHLKHYGYEKIFEHFDGGDGVCRMPGWS